MLSDTYRLFPKIAITIALSSLENQQKLFELHGAAGFVRGLRPLVSFEGM